MMIAMIAMTVLLLVALFLGGRWLWTPDKALADPEARNAGPPSEFFDAAGLRLLRMQQLVLQEEVPLLRWRSRVWATGRMK